MDPTDKNKALADELTVARLNIEERLIARASIDATFRKSLLTSPKTAIAQETGVILADDIVVTVHEESARSLHLVLPLAFDSPETLVEPPDTEAR